MQYIVFLLSLISFPSWGELFEKEEKAIGVEGNPPRQVKKDQEIITLEKELENITVRDLQNRKKTSLFQKLSQHMDKLTESQRDYQDYRDEYNKKINDFNKGVEQDQKEKSEEESEKDMGEKRLSYRSSVLKVLELKKPVLRHYCQTDKREQIMTGLKINGNGKVEGVRFYTDKLRDIHRCMAKQLSRFSFPQTPDSKEWQVDVPINLI